MTDRELEIIARGERNMDWLRRKQAGESYMDIARATGFHFQTVRNGARDAMNKSGKNRGKTNRGTKMPGARVVRRVGGRARAKMGGRR